MRQSSSASDLSTYRYHLASLQGAGETVILAQVVRDLGAIRNLVGESPTENAFPASLRLVYCTSDRLVVLMSTPQRATLCPVLGRWAGGVAEADGGTPDRRRAGCGTLSVRGWS